MVRPLRIAFLGTPTFALQALQRLHESSHQVVLVITQPDRPRGRGQKLVPSPVKAFAATHGLPLLQPERLREDELFAAVGAYELDLAVVAAYGKILPARLLSAPRLGTINVHGSLLPRWRGAAPVHRAILAGDRETGITIMRIVPALDAGPMLAREIVEIGPNETSTELESRLADLGANLLVKTVDTLSAGPVAEEAQPDDGVTYANRLERRESHVDWARPALAVHNHIRGLQPWPLATVIFRGRRLLLLGSEIADERPIEIQAGTVSAITPDAILVATRPGVVRITRVQLEGRAPMPVRQFLNGHRIAPGDRFDPVPLGA